MIENDAKSWTRLRLYSIFHLQQTLVCFVVKCQAPTNKKRPHRFSCYIMMPAVEFVNNSKLIHVVLWKRSNDFQVNNLFQQLKLIIGCHIRNREEGSGYQMNKSAQVNWKISSTFSTLVYADSFFKLQHPQDLLQYVCHKTITLYL